jgi:ribonuclease HII
LAGLRDSKQLSAAERERYSELIRACAVSVGVGFVSAALVDTFGLSAAGRLAMERATRALDCQPDYLLIDAFPLHNVHCAQEAIIFGDALCLTIAAASVIAKVERDRLMDVLGSKFPDYGLERNKGYGTAAHARALRALGPTPEHRQSYAPVRAVLEALSLP